VEVNGMASTIGSYLKKAYSECICCGKCCMGKTSKNRETSIVGGEFSDIPEVFKFDIVNRYIRHDRIGMQAGVMKTMHDGICLALEGSNCCKLYGFWRPAVCELFPFLPVGSSEDIKVLVNMNCESISSYVLNLNETQRERLRIDALNYFNTFSRDVIEFTLNYTKNYEEVVLV
jgi:Fe-S-cluster containining protein